MTSRDKKLWQEMPSLPDFNYVSGEVYTQPEIFKKEQDKIFSKTWHFVCHESELPKLFDYRVYDYTGKSIFTIRGEDGVVRSYFNVCSHRGAKLLSTPSGNAKRIKCFYHHWMYDSKGTCTGIPRPSAYSDTEVKKENMGLREIRTEVYFGMIFINLSDESESLRSYIGNALDDLSETMSMQPLEVFHYNKVLIHSNWKAWQETNMDIYHEFMHVVLRKTQVNAMPMEERKLSIFKNGHGGSGASLKASYTNYKGFANRKEEVSPLPGMTVSDFKFMNIFPSLTIIARGTAIRIDNVIPLTPDTAIIEMRGIGVMGESNKDRRARQKHHNQYWGPFGRNVPEDIIAAESCAESYRGSAGKYQIISRDEDGTGQDDIILRSFYSEWALRLGINPGSLKEMK